ncbi:MAG: hypothetical protein HGB37_03665 [Candidatus Moranbacteria bacterium]|jgi:hypothetical protein|nr:hypothetical protein [Candidatus Moranbacteria bacterium]
MKKFLFQRSFPLDYEFRVVEDPLSIHLSIAPQAFEFFRSIKEQWLRNCEEDGLVFTTSDREFGYGGILKVCEPHPSLPLFQTYSFTIPKGMKELRKLQLFSSSISKFVNLMRIMEDSPTDAETGGWKQLMTFDYIGHPHGELGEAGFVFTFAPEVLDFNGTKLWTDVNVESVLNVMRESYFRMLVIGKRERRNYRSLGFHFGWCYGSKEFINLRVPGNCACIGTYEDRIPGCGHAFSPHNVDNYFQQISLMMGVIKIANLAREALSEGRT